MIIHLLVSVAAIIIASYLLPGVTVTLIGALVLSIVLAVINLFIKPVLTLLTLPITLVTLGLFSLVINALLIMIAAAVVPGFAVAGFWSAFLFAILVSLITAVFGRDR